ncbi:hypothetical protein T440DRAFT_176146 [Plenodomus tracheiphilus IPT5]|uniref:SH3 domain-containing protein n=1 Tax=Plenodomus tracheiphilus IPT5 TaxID=1408161 RepID=A0A6A7AXS1_9PLEO|nr:hypothetical protein T440DRAFT_176146 [Plenodomus tracheiphilus IPT5]
MTRPHIIRADTIDLQNKTSPTAQDHSQQPQHPAPLGIGPAAPHQQAAIRHVEQERSSEEARLQNAWSNAGDNLQDEPGSDDERTLVNQPTAQANNTRHDHQTSIANGNASGNSNGAGQGDDANMQDADVDEDMDDDDMMDKISSSPSISDGGYSFPSYPLVWPARQASLTPQSSPMQSATASSSPFTNTPVHFPISVGDARRPNSVPARSLCYASDFLAESLPVSYQFSSSTNSKSTEHHPGEYAWTRTATRTEPNAAPEVDFTMSPRSKRLTAIECQLQMRREDSTTSLTSSVDEDLINTMLRPMRMPASVEIEDPFLSTTSNPPRTANGTPPPTKANHAEHEEDSWTTDSDADSWDEDLDHNEDDASKDVFFSDDPRFVDSGWGGECLRETEEIDFEFVYALHTFVATVEGQANATKGDTMVLLDDSNSYWWLVRVVKDSSIGYLPAEHIETPTERLARLNKHRNIDLSATMLGDTAEKSKNPLKKAIRRRNAKTVQFAPPTYVEASDYDYSSDEGDGELFGGPEPKQIQQQQQQNAQKTDADAESEEGLQVQPLKVNGGKREDGQPDGEVRGSSDSAKREDGSKTSEDDVDRPLDPKVSRNGTLRNTDSFFKDENTETRKITLTPNLLRDDSSTSTTGSKERGPSLESLEKNGFADKVKKEEKKKEKKSGMLSGLFKRKDKKNKGSLDSVDSDMERPDELDRSSPQSKPLDDSPERPSTADAANAPGPLRQSSKGKLQKSPRSRDDSPQKTKGILKTDSPIESPLQTEAELAESDSKPTGQQIAPTMRVVTSDQDDEARPTMSEHTHSSEGRTAMTVVNSLNPFSHAPRTHLNGEPKPEKVKQSKQRMQLDDFDSSSDESTDPFADPDAPSKSTQPQETQIADRLSESPVHISAADAQPATQTTTFQDPTREPDPRQPPALTTDDSSQETSSPISTPDNDSPMKTIPENSTLSTFRPHNEPALSTQTPHSAAPAPPSRPAPNPDTDREPSPPVSSSSSILPAWSDASLRAYLDDGSDIRDMLLVVNDTTGVVPVSREHPFMKTLFVQEEQRMKGLSSELDGLLKGLMDRRMKRVGSGKSTSSLGTVRSRSASGSLRVGR